MRYYQIILTLMCLLFVSWKAEAGWTGYRELGIVLFWQGHSGPLVNHQDGNMIDPENCGRKDWSRFTTLWTLPHRFRAASMD